MMIFSLEQYFFAPLNESYNFTRKQTRLKLLRSSFWLYSIFYTLLQRFSLFFFGTVSYMVLVRGLKEEGNETGKYAIWALYLMIITIFETVKQGLLRNPTIKFLGMLEHKENKAAVQSASLFINIVFSLICLLLLMLLHTQIASWLNAPQLSKMLLYSSFFIILLIPFNHCEIILQANFRFSDLFWSYFIRQGFFFIATLLLFFIFPQYFNLINLMWLQIAALFLGVVVLFFMSRSYLLKYLDFQPHIVSRMFHFGKFIFGTNLFSNLARSFDHFITAALLGNAGKPYVAYYNTVARINNMVDVPSLAAADVLFPKNVQTLENEGIEKVKYYFEKMVGTLLAVIVPVSLVIFIFPRFIIYILATSDYYGAVPILQLMILFSLVRPLSFQFGSTLDAIGKPNINFWANFFFMIIQLALTWFMLQKYGGMGAAYATAINSVITFFIMIAILKKYINVELLNIFRYIWMAYGDIYRMIRKVM
jgi:O-antigen/teichoic acid export membrane protein